MSSVHRLTEWVLVAGRWTRMSRMTNFRLGCGSEPSLVVVMIPGNPGNELFYAHFGERILQILHERGTPVLTEFVTVSHLNHVELPSDLKNNSELEGDETFKLAEQVQHKLDFFREHVSASRKTVVFGHSIGAFMALKILPELLSQGFNVAKVFGLFPTIEQMATSPNGVRLGGALEFFDSRPTLSKALLSWLWLLPDFVKRLLVRINLRGSTVPACVVEAAVEMVSSPVVRNVMHMARNELDTVVEHDESLFTDPDRMLLYYGFCDGWVPTECAKRQIDRFGNGRVVLDQDRCEHAFVIRDGEVMARNAVALVEKLLE